MKKIGITTFHRACNYGAVLQAYALQRVINDVGEYDVRILDYEMREIVHSYSPLYHSNKILKKPMYHPLRFWRFGKFRRTYLPCTRLIHSAGEYAQVLRKLDIGIWGSDQIWNRRLMKESDEPVFFGEGKCRKKFAYAASIGNEKETALLKKQKDLLDFDKISVRDERSKEIIGHVTGNDNIEVVLDPTLLLPREKWRELIGPKKQEEPYILYYEVNEDQSFPLAKKLSERLHMKLKVLSYHKYYHGKNIEHEAAAGPLEFLRLFYHADLVCTNSFHGTAFSINFNKPFYCIDRDKRKQDTRKYDLLDTFGLLDRIITQTNIHKIKDYKMDFSNVNQKLAEERQKSLQVLMDGAGLK